MASLRRLPKLLIQQQQHARRSFSASAALAVLDYDDSLPFLQNSQGDRSGGGPHWILLASPGVDKRTYASRLAKLLGVPHITMGDLLRFECSLSTAFSKEYANFTCKGKLMPDDVVCRVLLKRLQELMFLGESGFVLDGFPRTTSQAEALDEVTDIDLAVNLKLTEDAFMMKCMESQTGSQRGNLSVSHEELELSPSYISSLTPSSSSLSNMVSRQGDNTDIVRERMRAYSAQSKPVEYHYHKQGKLLDFEVLGGIPQTWPRLLCALRLEDNEAVTQHKLGGCGLTEFL